MFLEVFRGFQRFFRGPLRDPVRGRFPSQSLSVLLPLFVLPLNFLQNKKCLFCKELFSFQAGSRVYQKHARTFMRSLANFGEPTSCQIHWNHPDIHQISGEGPPTFTRVPVKVPSHVGGLQTVPNPLRHRTSKETMVR